MLLLLDTRYDQHHVGASRAHLVFNLTQSRDNKVEITTRKDGSSYIAAVINGKTIKLGYTSEYSGPELLNEANKDLINALVKNHGFLLFSTPDHGQ